MMMTSNRQQRCLNRWQRSVVVFTLLFLLQKIQSTISLQLDALMQHAIPRHNNNQDKEKDRFLYNNNYYNDDLYYNANGNVNNNNGYYYTNIDFTNYALKYVGCQNVNTFHDFDQYNGNYYNFDPPLIMNRFVIVKLCPITSCSAYNKYGCNSDNGGEYLLPMELYMQYMDEYHFKEKNRYCQTCYSCMNFNDNVAEDNTDDNVADDQVVANNDDDQAAANDDQAAVNDDQNDNYNNYGYYNYNNDDNVNNRKRNLYYYYNNYYYDDDGGANNNYYGDDDGGGANYNDDGNKAYYNDDYSNYNDNYNQYNNNYPWYIDSDGQCIFQNSCKNYKSACSDWTGSSYTDRCMDEYINDYGVCQKFQNNVNNGNNGDDNVNDDNYDDNYNNYYDNYNKNGRQYMGPHCASDGYTIEMALYNDYVCNNFSSKLQTSKHLDYSMHTCLSCDASDMYALIADDGSTSYYNGNNLNNNNPVCSAIYDHSAKCNRNFQITYINNDNNNDDDQYNNNNNNVQSEQDDNVCAFIESMTENNYDESGSIYLENDVEVSNIQDRASNFMRKASTGQLIGLFITMSIATCLSIYTIYLHKKLNRRKPWIPPIHFSSTSSSCCSRSQEAGRISRLNSGIVAMRSRSHESSSNHNSPYVPYGGSIPHRNNNNNNNKDNNNELISPNSSFPTTSIPEEDDEYQEMQDDDDNEIDSRDNNNQIL